MEKCSICGMSVAVACDDLELAQDIECGNLPNDLKQSKEEYEKESKRINDKLNKDTGKGYYW
jgi:hypothetical protein